MKKIQDLISEIRAFYQDNCPEVLKIYQKTPDDINEIRDFEKRFFALPEDYKYFLTNSDFEIQLENNFCTTSFEQAVKQLKIMSDLLDKETFAGWEEKRQIEKNNYGIKEKILKKCWWNKKWFPFAEDSAGNLKCIDLDPDTKGVSGQIIKMEIQDGTGPSATKYKSFTEYVNYHLELLLQKKYDIDSEGLITINPSK